MKTYIIVFSILILFARCGGITNSDTGNTPNGNATALDTTLPDDLDNVGSLWDKCQSQIKDNLGDILIPWNNPFKKLRDCLAQGLNTAYDQICNARKVLEEKKKNARDDDTKDHINSKLNNLELQHLRLKDKIHGLAKKFNKWVQKLRDKGDEESNIVLIFGYTLVEEQIVGIRDDLAAQSTRTCSSSN